MASKMWFVRGDGTKVVTGTDVSNGVAVVPIFQVFLRDGGTVPQRTQYALAGQPVDVAFITANQDPGSVPSASRAPVGAPGQERVTIVAAAGASRQIDDVSVATLTELTLNAASCALAFPPAAAGKSFRLRLKQDATGGRAVTWPAGQVEWPGGAAPVLSTAAGKVDVLRFVNFTGGKWTLEGVALDVR